MAGEGETLEIVPSSTSKKTFPMSLRVLVVDGDPKCLRQIETLLTRLEYQVVAVTEARSAVKLLWEGQGEFDMIMTDIHLPRMNGFQLLNIIKREFKIPVIMMSTDDKVKIISRGLTHGACLYLVKPIQVNDIRNLWQHVARWRGEQKIKLGLGAERNNAHPQTVVVNTEGTPSTNEDNSSGSKSKVPKNNEETGEASTSKEKMITKKPRMAWIPNLHAKFLQAINILGIDRAVPKEILSLMNVNGLTREHVASHLQKYRVFLKGLTELKEKGELPSQTRLNSERINLGPPSLTYNLPGNPQYLAQQQAQWQSCQPTGFGGYTASSSKQPVVPRYFNQEASNVNALVQVGQSFPMTSQGNGSLVQAVTAPPPPPPPSSAAQAEEQIEIGDDTWADLLRITSNNEFNFLSDQDNQSPNQQLDGDALMDFLFDINEYQMDGDNNPAS